MSDLLASLLEEFCYDDESVDENMFAILRAYGQGAVDGPYRCPVCGMRADDPGVAMDCCAGAWEEDHFEKGIEYGF